MLEVGVEPRQPGSRDCTLYHHTLLASAGTKTFLAVRKNAALRGGKGGYLENLLSILLDIYPEVELMDHAVILFLIS